MTIYNINQSFFLTGAKFHATTTISLPKTELLESTEALTKMPTRSGHGKTTTVSLTTSDVNKSPSVSHNKTSAVSSNHTFSSSEPQTITVPTVFPDNTITATDSHFSPTGESNCFYSFLLWALSHQVFHIRQPFIEFI